MGKIKEHFMTTTSMNNQEIVEAFVERARHETYMENVAYFQIARALYASRVETDETLTVTDDVCLKPEFLPIVAEEYYQMYETYIGDYDGREPRFDYDYLFHIKLAVLKFFLPYLRRADIINENGAVTTFKVSWNGITAMILPRGEETYVDSVDLASFFVTNTDTVMGPCDAVLMGMRVSQTPDDALEVFEVHADKISLEAVQCGVLGPLYNDISKRYYGHFVDAGMPDLN